MKFNTFTIGDVSTRNITKDDGELLTKESPYRIAIVTPVEDSPGVIFVVSGPDCIGDQLTDLKEAGFSPDFCALFNQASKAGIEYLRIDPICHPVEGAPKHNW